MKASIDIGSNSCLFLAGHFEGQSFIEKSNMSFVTGLGRGLDENQEFISEAIEDTFLALQKYREECDRLEIRPEEVIVTATEASRVARNAHLLYNRVEKELGFKTTIINGEGEAYYSSLGANLGLSGDDDYAVLMDIGGASTEFIKIQRSPFQVLSSISLPIGAVRLKEWKEKKIEKQKWQEVLEKFENSELYKTSKLIGIAGSITAQAAIYKKLKNYSDQEVHGLEIEVSDYQNFAGDIFSLQVEKISSLYPFLKKRAPYIHAGIDIVSKFIEMHKVERLVISAYGMRHGTLFEGAISRKFI